MKGCPLIVHLVRVHQHHQHHHTTTIIIVHVSISHTLHCLCPNVHEWPWANVMFLILCFIPFLFLLFFSHSIDPCFKVHLLPRAIAGRLFPLVRITTYHVLIKSYLILPTFYQHDIVIFIFMIQDIIKTTKKTIKPNEKLLWS